MREVIRNSYEVQSFQPKEHEEWLEQYERYLKLKEA